MGGRRGGCARGGCMPAAMGNENVVVFFFVFFFLRNRVVLKVERRRPVGPDRWAGPGTSHPDGTRLDERSYANIIAILNENETPLKPRP